MVLWVVGSILHGEPIELYLVPASAPQMPWYVLSCLWVGSYKNTTLLLIGKSSLNIVPAAGYLSLAI